MFLFLIIVQWKKGVILRREGVTPNVTSLGDLKPSDTAVWKIYIVSDPNITINFCTCINVFLKTRPTYVV